MVLYVFVCYLTYKKKKSVGCDGPDSAIDRMIMPFHKCYLFCLIIAALLLAGVTGRPRRAAADTGLHTLYLPSMIAQTQTIFGLNTTSLTPERGLDGLVASGTNWVRASNLFWRDVEPVE